MEAHPHDPKGPSFSSSINHDGIAEFLYEEVKIGQWSKVVSCYKDMPLARRAQLTTLGETALHLALYYRNHQASMQLISFAIEDREVLAVRTKSGDTVLHVAAMVGMVDACRIVAGTLPELVWARNESGETPLFLAASGGSWQTFSYLHSEFGKERDAGVRRGSDGNTILHCTIQNAHFDLALLIIKLYDHLAIARNEMGDTPLHLLARKRLVFVSATFRMLGVIRGIISRWFQRTPYASSIISNVCFKRL